MEVLNEWGVNIYKFKINEKEEILEGIFDSMKLDNNNHNQSDQWNAKISRVIGVLPSPQPPILKFLRDKIEKHIRPISDFTSVSFISPLKENVLNCADLWINVYEKGDFQGIHRHIENGDAKFSFVYFAKYNPDTDAKLIIGNPKTTELMLMSGDLKIIEKKIVPVNEGEVVIFPSYLPHYVEKHESDTQRITVAGNLFRL